MEHADPEAEDDDFEPEQKQSREQQWFTKLCGSGAHLWPHISLELTYLFAAATIATIGAILRSTCTAPKCFPLGAQISNWVMWAAFSCAISVPGRIIDKLFFAGLSAIGEILAGSLLGWTECGAWMIMATRA